VPFAASQTGSGHLADDGRNRPRWFAKPQAAEALMPEIDINRLVWIVVGVQLTAELGDRPLAYRIEQRLKERLDAGLGETPAGVVPPLSPAVISDVYYLNSDDAQTRPAISIGGPGVNALSAQLVNELPTVIAIENTLVVQMDLEMNDLRAAIWGMNHVETVKAVELFVDKGYLDAFVRGVIAHTKLDEG